MLRAGPGSARSETNRVRNRVAVGALPAQYAALAGYVLAEALIFVPLLWVANAQFPGAIKAAALALFAFVALMFWYVLRLFMRRN